LVNDNYKVGFLFYSTQNEKNAIFSPDSSGIPRYGMDTANGGWNRQVKRIRLLLKKPIIV
jgi:hypothetical protein